MDRTVGRIQNSDSRRNKKAEEKIFTFDTVLFLCIVAAILISLVSWQNYRINRTDIQISKLQSELKEAKMLNDSLEGKLLAKRDLNKVQEVATKKYGMIKPGNSYFVAVNIEGDGSEALRGTESAKAQNKGEGTLSRFLGGLAGN